MNQNLEKLPTTVNNDSAFYAQMAEDDELSDFELEMVAAGGASSGYGGGNDHISQS
jgi:hypothetical protein